MDSVTEAVASVEDGQLIVYPTETVYGLGADALDPGAIERVYAAKDRPRTNPMALAVPSIEAAMTYIDPDDVTESFMAAFLPGPVTVIAKKRPIVPDVLTGDRDRVGVRIPDYEIAQRVLQATSPLTATSANVSGMQPVREVSALDETIRRSVETIIDGGKTPGGASTVVDVSDGRIHRHGRKSTAVEAWLDDHVR